ncbi:diacylglycerol/lipid kinase family protein [Bacillus sp. N9]
MNKQLVFIVNPAAKNGYSQKVWNKIRRKLERIPHDVYYTKGKEDGMALAQQIATNTNQSLLLVAVGGDGTIHEVVNGAIEYEHVTFAYIPTGSGNDFAKGYKLPANPAKCLDVILHLLPKEAKRVDCGVIRGETPRYFVNSVGVGFDAIIAKRPINHP